MNIEEICESTNRDKTLQNVIECLETDTPDSKYHWANIAY